MWRAARHLETTQDLIGERAAHLRGESTRITSAKLKLVDACNLRCFMCDYWRGRREGELTTPEVLAVLRDLAALGCQKVHFTGGELFLRRDALELLAAAHALGMRVNLTSNGTLLDKDTARALLAIPVRSITLSLDSPIRKLHDEVRGREGAWKRTVKALSFLAEHRGPKTRLSLNTVVSARTYRSLVDLPELIGDKRLDRLLLIPMDQKPATSEEGPLGAGAVGAAPRLGTKRGLPRLAPTPHAMSRADITRYNEDVAPILERLVRIPGFDAYPFGRSREDVEHAAEGRYARGHYVEHMCHVPWFHTLVNATGDVYPCCMGHRGMPALGNVRQASLVDVVRGPRYRGFRLEMLQERKPICHRCDDFLAENKAIDATLAARATPTGSAR